MKSEASRRQHEPYPTVYGIETEYTHSVVYSSGISHELVGGGIAEKMREKSKSLWHGFSRGFDRRDREKRLVTPPVDTRAHFRGRAVQNNGDVYEWHQFAANDKQSADDHPVY